MADSLLAALEELNEQELRASEYASDAVLVIDNDLRTIAVPSNFIFGVYNDKNVLSVNFEMPRTYDDVDLSDFTIQINYLAPNKVGNVYEVTDPVVGEDKITFEWLLDRGVFLSSGTVEFTVCLREIGQEGAIIREFNTTIAKGTVLAGLEIEDPEDPEAYSLLAHIKQMDERVTSQAATVATDYAKTARMADDVEAIAEELADDVAEVKEKYGSPLVAPTASGMLDKNRIYVYTGSETGYTFGNWYYWDGTAWTSGGVYNSAGVNTDSTLSVTGMPADAKKTGDEISGLKEDLDNVEGFTSEIKTALLNCFQNVGWKGDDGDDYIEALTRALYGERFVVSISASFDAHGNTIHVLDGINSLKQYLTVTATFNTGDTEVASNYTLSGTMKEGTCTITVAIGLVSSTFTVNVSPTVVTTLTGADLLEGGFSGVPTSYGEHYNRAYAAYPRATYTYFAMPVYTGNKYRISWETSLSGNIIGQVRYLTSEGYQKVQNLETINLDTELLYFETGWKNSGFEFTSVDGAIVVWFTLQRGTNEALVPNDITSVTFECIEAA